MAIANFKFRSVVSTVLATRYRTGATNGLLTLQMDVPGHVWTHILTHKRLARNAASHRAMKGGRFVDDLGMWAPLIFYQGKARGMGDNGEPLTEEAQWEAREIWGETGVFIANQVERLMALGVAKEQYNRLLTCAHMVRGVVTATEAAWGAVLALRDHPSADRATQEWAVMVRSCLESAQWRISARHLPYLDETEMGATDAIPLSAGRLAKVSYGAPGGAGDDAGLGWRLLEERPAHASPFEHIAYIAHTRNAIAPSALFSKPSDVYMGHAWVNWRAHLEGEADGLY